MLTFAGHLLTVVLTLKSLGINTVDSVDTFPRYVHIAISTLTCCNTQLKFADLNLSHFYCIRKPVSGNDFV